jgi:hypothetical protein
MNKHGVIPDRLSAPITLAVATPLFSFVYAPGKQGGLDYFFVDDDLALPDDPRRKAPSAASQHTARRVYVKRAR